MLNGAARCLAAAVASGCVCAGSHGKHSSPDPGLTARFTCTVCRISSTLQLRARTPDLCSPTTSFHPRSRAWRPASRPWPGRHQVRLRGAAAGVLCVRHAAGARVCGRLRAMQLLCPGLPPLSEAGDARRLPNSLLEMRPPSPPCSRSGPGREHHAVACDDGGAGDSGLHLAVDWRILVEKLQTHAGPGPAREREAVPPAGPRGWLRCSHLPGMPRP